MSLYPSDTVYNRNVVHNSVSGPLPSSKNTLSKATRFAATLFLWFMQNNGILYRPDGTKRVADAALVALTLMIAESHTDEMETMVKVVVNLINQKVSP